MTYPNEPRLINWKGLLVLILGLALFLTGCAEQPPREGDVRGTWIHDGDSAQSIQLDRDGTFVLRGLPEDIFPEWSGEGTGLSGQGTWQLAAKKPGSYFAIDLLFDATDTTPPKVAQLFVMRTSSGSELFFVKGDPDSHNFYTYQREG